MPSARAAICAAPAPVASARIRPASHAPPRHRRGTRRPPPPRRRCRSRVAATEEALGVDGAPIPYWAFAWAGGLALARWLQAHPDEVAGRSVLDFGTGSGLVAIVAARGGRGARRPPSTSTRSRRRQSPSMRAPTASMSPPTRAGISSTDRRRPWMSCSPPTRGTRVLSPSGSCRGCRRRPHEGRGSSSAIRVASTCRRRPRRRARRARGVRGPDDDDPRGPPRSWRVGSSNCGSPSGLSSLHTPPHGLTRCPRGRQAAAIDHYDKGQYPLPRSAPGRRDAWRLGVLPVGLAPLMRSGPSIAGWQIGVWRTFDRDGRLVKETDLSAVFG